MTEVLISVVIPAYNYAKTLPRALDSILVQWADDIELIVINDGSRDNTREVLDDYQVRYADCLQVVHQDNAGVAAARNRGIGMARGVYVLLLDADDELTVDALSILRNVIVRSPHVGMILGAYFSVYPNGKERLRFPTPVSGSVRKRAEDYLLRKKISVSHCCSLFRRDLLLERPYPEELRSGEDIPVFLHLLLRAEVVCVDEPLARIHKHATSLRHSRTDDSVTQIVTREVASVLPAECQSMLADYESQRYLSRFRTALRQGDRVNARHLYWRAVKLSRRQALQWRYLRKVLKLGFWVG
ncbi:glycosyltransferase family 2 protein [Pseudomonas sp. N-137]|uniref:glycosyltransferase family 2 protein n=1 Tax=unclassified Pseudomonas TaxID=196821 RepID=UPI0023645D1E|nr:MULTISPECIES: glycosyltransferase family 2 protein [unclassified Pseudomonas]MDD2031891.1 glycosyltransferase [Pseudomonas sp. 39167]MEA1029002.1 glycosyltransferase family 2 protein [Pseudomonas sp. N-137]